MEALEQINNANKNICKNIEKLDKEGIEERGFFSENILNGVRNFVEGVLAYIYNVGNRTNIPFNKENYNLFKNYVSSISKYNYIMSFHRSLQQTKSHYAQNEDVAERLMVKYLKNLYEIKKMFSEDFNIDVLENLSKFPLYREKDLIEFYEKIAEELECEYTTASGIFTNKYYVQKVKPFFVNDILYYEITLSSIYDYASKFDRTIIYSKKYIETKYCVEVTYIRTKINFIDSFIDVNILLDYRISVRPCELEKLAKIFNYEITITRDDKEYKFLMDYLNENSISILDICTFTEKKYSDFCSKYKNEIGTLKILKVIEKSRDLILKNKPGKNVMRYLLYMLNNRTIKEQIALEQCTFLSNLCLNIGCTTFESTPYSASLIFHNPTLVDLFESIDSDGRDDELFARAIMANSKNTNSIYYSEENCFDLNQANKHIKTYNGKLYYKHKTEQFIEKDRRIKYNRNNFYINQIEGVTVEIIKKLLEYSKFKLINYKTNTVGMIEKSNYKIDDEKKKEIIIEMFEKSTISAVYGPAGTGKTTLIKHFSYIYSSASKIYISQTNNAVEHLKHQVEKSNSLFYTASKISKLKEPIKTNLVIIDEANTIDNITMFKILKNINCDAILLVGDIFQIEAIECGNWFNIIRYFLPKESLHELINTYRNENDEIKTLWEKVRKFDEDVQEFLYTKKYSQKITSDIFVPRSEDEIILCLNYNGIYGINSINKYFQNRNKNKEFFWMGKTYKIGDPILFDDNITYSPIFYNNLKGKIVNIELDSERIEFILEVDTIINQFDIRNHNVELLEFGKKGKSLIKLIIYKKKNLDDDDSYNNYYYIPFQVTYAISIHKAQGLEYESVKIIVTDEIEEQINHSIFYTAITRTKNLLRIYWSPEIENIILNKFEKVSYAKDAQIISGKYKIKINNNKYIRSFH